MSRTFGYIALVIVVGAGLYIASQQTGSVTKLTKGNPRATVELTGVQNDLLAIAHAERRYMASNGKYAGLDELISSGELTMRSTARGPYAYSVETSPDGFLARATAENPPQGAPRVIQIDQEMQITRE